MMGRVSLVAHRGQPQLFPENSLEGFSHVLEHGATYLETDVHITADGIPVLSHDANLLKLTGKQIIISNHEYPAIKDMSAGFPERFGKQFADCRISTLEQFATLVKKYSDVICFIELKSSSLDYFGNKAVDLVIKAIEKIKHRCVLISFDYDGLNYAKDNHDIPLGWVVDNLSDENRVKANELEPEYLFISKKLCNADKVEIWQGNWKWVIYTVDDAQGIIQCAGMGIELIETDRFSDIVKESDIIEVSNDF